MDGTLALDAIGARKKYCGEFSAWVKDHKGDRPELVLYSVSEILGIKDASQIMTELSMLVLRQSAMTPELRKRWPRKKR